jgi:putative ABC transport system permease protein
MNIISIVTKNLRKRLLSTCLTILSVLLGVSMIVAIYVIQSETERSFNQTSVGYDLILTAKGSQLQATLNALYHLETSVGIVPYSLYETAKRDPRVEKAFPLYVGDSYNGFRVVGTSSEFLETAEPRRGQPFSINQGKIFDSPLQAVLGSEVARRTRHKIGDQIQIQHGLFEPVPGAEAHVHDNAPVTIVGILSPSGTANDKVVFTDLYTTHALHDPRFHIDDLGDHDRADHSHDSDHSQADHSHTSHNHSGNHDHSGHNHSDDNLVGDHEHPEHGHSEIASDIRERITLKELDAVLVKMSSPAAALQLSGMINYPTPDNPLLARNLMRDPFFQYKEQIMAVIPAMQIMSLMSIVGNAEVVLRFVAWFVVIVALTGVLIALYNTMEERKRDLAVMRALGASRTQVFSIIVLEAIFLCAIGSVLGILFGHLLVYLSIPYLTSVAGIVITAFVFDLYHLYLFIGIVVLGAIAGLIPALKAYNSEVIRNLGSGK